MATELLNKAQTAANKEKARKHPKLAKASARLAVAVEALFESDGWGDPEEDVHVAVVWDAIEAVVSRAELRAALVVVYENVPPADAADPDVWRKELPGRYTAVSGFLMVLPKVIEFGANAEGAAVLAAMEMLPDVLAYRSRLAAPLIPARMIDETVVNGPWKRLVFGHPAHEDGAVNRHAYAFCVLEQFYRHLKRREIHARTERAAAARAHAAATLALAQPAAAELAALARLHADAAAFYAAQLAAGSPDAARATALLTARAVPAAAVAGYELGYAPPGWTALVDHLRARGYTDAQLLDAGVGLRTRRGTVVDRFRDRLMFPVRDPGGQRIVGFLGRALVEAEDTPRYLNSPATALYRKGEVLYGLGAEPTRQALAAGARPVLVEGPLDAIAVTCATAGRYAGVAPCGTALTAAQVTVLDTHAGPLADRRVIDAFDHDTGGRQAALRAYELLRSTGAWPTSASLPDGLDPAALAQQRGLEALRSDLDNAPPLADLVVDDRLTRWADRLHWAEGRVGAAPDAAAGIATLPPEQVGRQVLRVAERVGLDHAEVTRAVTDAVSRDGDAVGRVGRRDLRGDLDRGWESPPPGSAVQLARASYPRRPTGPPAAAGLSADDAWRPTAPAVAPHRSAGLRR